MNRKFLLSLGKGGDVLKNKIEMWLNNRNCIAFSLFFKELSRYFDYNIVIKKSSRNKEITRLSMTQKTWRQTRSSTKL